MEKLVEQMRKSSDSSEVEKTQTFAKLDSLIQEVETLKRQEEINKSEFSEVEASLKNEVERLKCEKDEIYAANQQLCSDLEIMTIEKSELVQKVDDLKQHIEGLAGTKNEDGKFSDTFQAELVEKQIQLETLERELSETKSKLAASENKLNDEFNSNTMVENLKLELADAKCKINELESRGGPSEQAGWSDLPDIAEEPERESQADQGQIISHLPGNESDQVIEPEFVYTERIEKFIKVSSHVVDGESAGDSNRVEALKAKIFELEKEKTALNLALEQVQIQSQVNASDVTSGLDIKYTEIINKLQGQKQHLEEKLVVLGYRQETLTFELVEMHAEKDSMKSELGSLRRQLQEWENMMAMLKEEKDSLAQELEESVSKDAALRKELEFLLSSLNEAITERDTLQDEVFKLSQHEDSAQGDVKEMKGMIQDIIMERNSLLSELDSVLLAKSDLVREHEALKQEFEQLRVQKEDVEREKDTLLVRLHVGEDLHQSLSEENEGLLEKCSSLEGTNRDLQRQLDNSPDCLKKEPFVTEEQGTMTEHLEEQVSIPESQVNTGGESQDNVHKNVSSETNLTQNEESQSDPEKIQPLKEKLLSAKQNTESELNDLPACDKDTEDFICKMKNDLLQTENEKKELEKLLEETKGKLLILEQKIEKLIIERNEAVEEAERTKETLQECDSLNKRLENELEQNKLSLSTYQENISELKVSLSESQNLLQQRDADLGSCLEEKSDLLKKQDSLQQTLVGLETEHRNTVKLVESLSEEKQTLLVNINECQEKMLVYHDRSSVMEQELSLLKDSSASSENCSANLLLQQSKAELAKLEANLGNVVAELDRERQKADSLELSLVDIKSTYEQRYQETQNSLIQITQEKDDLIETLHQQKIQFSELEQTFQNIHESFQQKLKTLEALNDELVSEIKQLENKFEDKSTELEDRESELSALKKVIETINTDCHLVLDSVDSSRSQFLGSEHCPQEESADLTSVSSDNKDLGITQIIESSGNLKLKLASQIEQLQKEHEQLTLQLRISEQTVEELRQELKTSETKTEQLNENFQSLLNEKDSLASAFKDISLEKENLASLLNQVSIEKESLETSLKESILEKETLLSKLEELNARNTSLDSRLKELNAEKESLESSLKEANELKETLATTLKELKTEKESLLESSFKELATEKESMESSWKKLIDEKTNLDSKLKESYQEKDTLAFSLSELKSEKESLESSLKEVNQEKETLTAALSEFKIDKESLESNLKDVIAKKESLQSSLKELQAEKEYLELSLREIGTEKETLLSTVIEIGAEKETLLSTVKEIGAEKETLLSTVIEIGAEKETLLSTVKEIGAEKETLLSTVKEFGAEKETLLSTVKEIGAEKDNLEKRLNSVMTELESLKQTFSEQVLSSGDKVDSKVTDSVGEVKGKLEIREEHMQASSQETTDVEQLRKELIEKEKLNSKLKQLAIKAKKELGEKQVELDAALKELKQLTKCKEELELASESAKKQTTESSENLTQQLKNLQDKYKQLQSSFDAVQDEVERNKNESKQAHRDIELLINQSTELKSQLASSKEEKENFLKQIETLKAELKVKDGNCDELKTKLRVTETELGVVRIQLEEFYKEKQILEHKMADAEAKWKSTEEDYKSQITKFEMCTKDLQDQLSVAKQSMKQNSMLDLEMADYERTISTLHSQLEERDKKIEELRSELDKLEQRIALMQTQICASEEQRVQADSRASKLKSLLVKTKKELSEARQQETTQKSSEFQLRAQLEDLIQQIENFKVEISDLTGENLRLQERLKMQNDHSLRTAKSLESQVDSLKEELQVSRKELEIVQADYESYKVRVHSVLKQQKAKSPSDSIAEIDKQEKARYETAIDQHKGKLQEAHTKLDQSKKDNELLQNEHDHLAHRHAKLISDLEEKEAHFKLRLEEIQKDKADNLNELMEKITGLEVQKTFLSQKHKEQMIKLKEDHASTLELLQKQIDASEMDNIRLQREIQSLQRVLRGREEASIDHPSPHDFHPISAHPVEERQEGEGSEVVDHEPVKIKTNLQTPSYTFEQLITTPLNELPGMKSPPPTPLIDEETLKMNLSASQKKIDHLTQLLSESEASVSMLTEQARILKEEIRRLERNIERERETQNMEYLKNIFLQFMCPKVGEQRLQLVPVLATMLKLSPEEKGRIVAVAQSDDQGGQPGAQGAGWGAYLHRWSGLT
ncbi:hypothetical protein Btru_023325 [Bulinus truncatus]|nr:hypothetical protein Btru_023325 [Bulinus truncatus]